MSIKSAMSNGLSMLKGFNTAHTTRSDRHLIVDYNGARYVVNMRKIRDNADEVDILEDVNKYIPTINNKGE